MLFMSDLKDLKRFERGNMPRPAVGMVFFKQNRICGPRLCRTTVFIVTVPMREDFVIIA